MRPLGLVLRWVAERAAGSCGARGPLVSSCCVRLGLLPALRPHLALLWGPLNRLRSRPAAWRIGVASTSSKSQAAAQRLLWVLQPERAQGPVLPECGGQRSAMFRRELSLLLPPVSLEVKARLWAHSALQPRVLSPWWEAGGRVLLIPMQSHLRDDCGAECSLP